MDKFDFLNPVLQAPRRQATVSLLRQRQDAPPAAAEGDAGAGAGEGVGDDPPPEAGEQQEQPPPVGAVVNPGMYCPFQ